MILTLRGIFITAALLASLFACSYNKRASQNTVNNKLHSPPQVLKIMTDSKINYVIVVLKDSLKTPADSLPVLPNQYYLITSDSGRRIGEYDLHGASLKLFVQGETSFKENNLSDALTSFKALVKAEPHYAYALTLTGDVYYTLQKYDSAEFYFKRALQLKSVDYSARWFLADTYWKNGNGLNALKNIYYAHLMNRNNPRLLRGLKYYARAMGHNWDGWKFTPQFRLSQNGNKVVIESAPGWLGYAMVKALWKYEPGYAQSITGQARNKYTFILAEEAEAVMSLISANKNMKFLEKIVNDGYFPEFFYYEIVSPKNPLALLSLRKDEIERLVEYVERYH
jgi:tetratricopeptide (TPR) repeat protein